jgi:hypothetical protein
VPLLARVRYLVGGVQECRCRCPPPRVCRVEGGEAEEEAEREEYLCVKSGGAEVFSEQPAEGLVVTADADAEDSEFFKPD